MNYKTSSPTVKCEKCEERLTDFEAYENHMAHMHGSSPSEESVVDWTLITDEDIITKDGNKYRVGGESINWSPNFDKEARIFLEEKYQKGKIDMLSKKKINEAKKFVKALEFDTNKHYDNLINKIEGKGEDSYNELFPNEKQVFPQNKMPSKKWFSHQKNQADVTDVIQDQGYFDDPNEVMGSQTKKFSKGKYHIDEPVAKEQFSTSFYGDYLGESKVRDEDAEDLYHEWRTGKGSLSRKGSPDKDSWLNYASMFGLDAVSAENKWKAWHYLTQDESKAKESMEDEVGLWWDSMSPSEREQQIEWHQADNWEDHKNRSWRELQSMGYTDDADTVIGDVTIQYTGKFFANQGLDDEQWNQAGGDWDGNHSPSWSNSWVGALHNDNLSTKSGNTLNYESKANEGESVVNKHGVEYELDDEDDGLYNDLYYQQIDEGDEKEVFELLDKYNDNYPYASLKDMENEIERTIGWVSDDRDIQTLVLQWQDFRYS